MKPLRFYEHFACGYGTVWLVLLGCSLLTQKHINAGSFGLLGFPIIALVYAFIRKSSSEKLMAIDENLRAEIQKLRHELKNQKINNQENSATQ